MLNVRTGTVVELLERRRGIEKLEIAPEGAPGARRRAVNYPALCGSADRGDRVLLNTTAVDLGLGTGGWDFVIANLSRAEREPSESFGEATAGHLMKLRYAPHQVALQAAEELESDLPDGLDGRPVLVAELHSQIAPALVGIRLATGPGAYPRVVYLMPDAAALSLALSETIPLLATGGWIHATITCGHAFGGDHEAVTLASGMLIGAGPAGGDLLVVAQGPGNAGTATALGFGGLYQAEALHLAVALDGDPIVAARSSGADPRSRHFGLSHHTRTLLDRLLLAPVTVGIPDDADWAMDGSGDVGSRSGGADREPRARPGHRMEKARARALMEALRSSGLTFSSMGRGLEQDPSFFLAAAAGGWAAGRSHLRRIESERRTP